MTIFKISQLKAGKIQEESILKWHGHDEIPLENGECVEDWIFAWVLTMKKEQVFMRPEIVKFNPYTGEWRDPANQVVFVTAWRYIENPFQSKHLHSLIKSGNLYLKLSSKLNSSNKGTPYEPN